MLEDVAPSCSFALVEIVSGMRSTGERFVWNCIIRGSCCFKSHDPVDSRNVESIRPSLGSEQR